MELSCQILGPRATSASAVLTYLVPTGGLFARRYSVRATFALRYDLDGTVCTDTVLVGDVVRPWLGTPAASAASGAATLDLTQEQWVILALPAGGGVTHLYTLPEERYRALCTLADGGGGFGRADEPGCPGSGEPVFLPLEVVMATGGRRYQIVSRLRQATNTAHCFLLTGTQGGAGQYGWEQNPALYYPETGGAAPPIGGTNAFMLALPQMRLAVSAAGDTLAIAQDGTLWFCAPGQDSPGVALTLPVGVPGQTESHPIAVAAVGTTWSVLVEVTDKHPSASGHGDAYTMREVLLYTSGAYTPGAPPSQWGHASIYVDNRLPGIASLDADVDFLAPSALVARFPAAQYPRVAELADDQAAIVTGGRYATQPICIIPHFDGTALLDGYLLGQCEMVLPDGTALAFPQQVVPLPAPADPTITRVEQDDPGEDLASTYFYWYTVYEVWAHYDGTLSHREVAVPPLGNDAGAPDMTQYPQHLPPAGDYLVGTIVIIGAGLPYVSDRYHGTPPGPHTQDWVELPDLNCLVFGYDDHGNPFPLGPTHNLDSFQQYGQLGVLGPTGGAISVTEHVVLFDDQDDGTTQVLNGWVSVPGTDVLHGYPETPDTPYTQQPWWGNQDHTLLGWWWANSLGNDPFDYQGATPLCGWATDAGPDDQTYVLGAPSLGANPYHPLQATMATIDTENYGVTVSTWGFTGAARFYYDANQDLYGGYLPVDPAAWPGYEAYTVPIHPRADFGFTHLPALVPFGQTGTSINGSPRVPLDPEGWMRDSVYGGYSMSPWADGTVPFDYRVRARSRFAHSYACYRAPQLQFRATAVRPAPDLCVLTFWAELCYAPATRTWTNGGNSMDAATSAAIASRLGTPTAPGTLVPVRQSAPGQPVLVKDAILYAGVLDTSHTFLACCAGTMNGYSGNVLWATDSAGDFLQNGTIQTNSSQTVGYPTTVYGTDNLHPIVTSSSVTNADGTVTTTTTTIQYSNYNPNDHLYYYYFNTVISTTGWQVLVPQAVPVGDDVILLSYMPAAGTTPATWLAVHGHGGGYQVTQMTVAGGAVPDAAIPAFRFPTNEQHDPTRFLACGLSSAS